MAGRSREKNTDEKLVNAADLFDRISSALRMAAAGECSMTEACRRKQLDYLSVRLLIQTKTFEKCDAAKNPKPLATVKLDPTPYEQLYIDTFRIDDPGTFEFPPDIEETVQAVFETLTEREKKVLAMRYGLDTELPMTLDEVGKEFSVGRERIRQIEAKALRKLRTPSRSRRLLMGEEKYQADIRLKEKEKELRRKAIEEWIDSESEKVILGEKLKLPEDAEGIEDFDPVNVPISDLDLSVRTYNCLRRAGKTTLADLLVMSDEQLPRIRNLGKVGVEELMAVREKMGARAAVWKQVMVQKRTDPAAIPIEDLELSVRAYNCLRLRSEIRTLKDLIDADEDQLRGIRCLGKKTLDEIIEKRDRAIVELDKKRKDLMEGKACLTM